MALSTNQQQVSPALRIGQLRRRVTLLQPTLKQDSDGGTPLTNLAPVMELWATIDGISAQDRFAAHSFVEQSNTKITIRYQEGIKHDMMISDGPDLYIIKGLLDPDKRKRLLLLYCVMIDDSQRTQMGIGLGA